MSSSLPNVWSTTLTFTSRLVSGVELTARPQGEITCPGWKWEVGKQRHFPEFSAHFSRSTALECLEGRKALTAWSVGSRTWPLYSALEEGSPGKGHERQKNIFPRVSWGVGGLSARCNLSSWIIMLGEVAGSALRPNVKSSYGMASLSCCY